MGQFGCKIVFSLEHKKWTTMTWMSPRTRKTDTPKKFFNTSELIFILIKAALKMKILVSLKNLE